MKKLLFMMGLGLTVLALSPKQLKAQVSINVNIGAQPLWGPVGYDRVDYYYLPDIESYYYVPTRQFVYLSNGRWIFGASLPSRYRGYDLYRGYKVVINQPRPYLNHRNYKAKYYGYRGYNGRQPVIRYSNDSRYYVVKGHPKYNNSRYYRGDRDDDRDDNRSRYSYYRGDRDDDDDDRRRSYNNYRGDRDGYKNASYGKGKGNKGKKD